jgi:hypothetical protein
VALCGISASRDDWHGARPWDAPSCFCAYFSFRLGLYDHCGAILPSLCALPGVSVWVLSF